MFLRFLVLLLVGQFELLFWSLWTFLDSNLYLLIMGLFACCHIPTSVANNAAAWAKYLSVFILAAIDKIYALQDHWTTCEGSGSSTPYPYDPLDSGRSQIRLIQITKSTPFAAANLQHVY